MKNCKQFICGAVIGAVTALSITVLAEYIINPNPYPVKVNGEQVGIEGYNINDSTYFKLRDIGERVGFSVNFVNDQIVIVSEQTVPTPDVKPAETPNPKLDPTWAKYAAEQGMQLTPDGLPIQVLEDGNKYVYADDIEIVYDFERCGYRFADHWIIDEDDHILLDGIQNAPDSIRNNLMYISAAYYESTLLPWVQEHCS